MKKKTIDSILLWGVIIIVMGIIAFSFGYFSITEKTDFNAHTINLAWDSSKLIKDDVIGGRILISGCVTENCKDSGKYTGVKVYSGSYLIGTINFNTCEQEAFKRNLDLDFNLPNKPIIENYPNTAEGRDQYLNDLIIWGEKEKTYNQSLETLNNTLTAYPLSFKIDSSLVNIPPSISVDPSCANLKSFETFAVMKVDCLNNNHCLDPTIPGAGECNPETNKCENYPEGFVNGIKSIVERTSYGKFMSLFIIASLIFLLVMIFLEKKKR